MTKRDARGVRSRGDTLARLDAALTNEPGALTASGRLVIAFIRDNLASIPFETGASIATKTGVSEMTVIRCIQALGYANLRDLKNALRAARLERDDSFDDVLDLFHVRRDRFGDRRESLELQLRAVIRAYELASTEPWNAAVEHLATKRRVFIIGLLATKGTALDFASRLMTARKGVLFVDGSEGIYAEILESDPDETCSVFVDTAAQTRWGPLFARRAHGQGLPLIIITNRFSNWGYEFTDLVLQGHTNVNTFWDSTASLAVITNLLVDAVATRLGKKAEDRVAFMKELGRYFGTFDWARQRRPLSGGAARRKGPARS